MRRALVLLLAPVAVAVVIAGCGGGSSTNSATHGGAAAKAGGAAVMTRHTSLGTILVDANGRSLYLFEKDKGPMSTCNGSCAALWPPATTAGKPVAGHGVSAAKLATSMRSDGSAQATYAGHPLYTYAGDAKPGDVMGQDVDQFGAKWYVLAPSGHKIDNG